MRLARKLLLLALMAVAALALAISSSPEHDEDSEPEVHIIKLGPDKSPGEYDCRVFVPTRDFGAAFQVEAAAACKSLRVSTKEPPALKAERCHIQITAIRVPAVPPPVVLPLNNANPFQGSGCKRAVWSFRSKYDLILDARALRVDFNFRNRGKMYVRPPKRIPLDGLENGSQELIPVPS